MNMWLLFAVLLPCVNRSSEVFAPSFFAESPFISSEELSEEEANRLHPVESQSGSVEDNINGFTTVHYVVWDDYRCKFYDYDIFFFVDCYMRYFGFKHHGQYVHHHKGLYSKINRVIKMGAINAIIKYFTGCDLLLTNEDDPAEWVRESKVREIKAENPVPRCKHVHRHRQSQLVIQKERNTAVKIYYKDKDGNSISVESENNNFYHISITALHKGVMVLSRTGRHNLHFGLQCLLCGDSIEVYEDCEWRKVRYSNDEYFDLQFSNACEKESSENSDKSSSSMSESESQGSEELKISTEEMKPTKQLTITTEEATTEATATEVTSTSIQLDSTARPTDKGRVIDFGERLIRGGQAGIH